MKRPGVWKIDVSADGSLLPDVVDDRWEISKDNIDEDNMGIWRRNGYLSSKYSVVRCDILMCSIYWQSEVKRLVSRTSNLRGSTAVW